MIRTLQTFLQRIALALLGSKMLRFVLRRIFVAIPVLFGIIFVSFMLVRAVPGGPFDFLGSRTMPAEVRAALSARYGLDRPLLLNLPSDGAPPDLGGEFRVSYPALPDCDAARLGNLERPAEQIVDVYEGWHLLRIVTERREQRITVDGQPVRCLQATPVLYSDLTRSQFFEYLNNVLRLDFGLSLGRTTLGQSVSDLIGDRLPVSARLGVMALIVGYLIGIPLGVASALYRNTPIDYSITFSTAMFVSIPTLVLGPVLIIVFVVQLGLLPGPNPTVWKSTDVLSWEFISRAILPVMTLGTGIAAGLARLTRASVLQVLRDDYIRTARAKGMRERRVIYIHALKNALIPVVTIIGPQLAGVLTGTLIIERIFAIPGLGESFVSSIAARDYNLLVGVTILYATLLILGNILVDVMYTWLDPRIRFD
jgi:ABC-type dipeptide/oligopeptide/nickel transport system permease component